MTEPENIYDLSFKELTIVLNEMGQPRYCAKQVWEWLYKHFVNDFESMSNLSKTLRSTLSDRFSLKGLQPVSTQYSTDRQTKKVLFQLADKKLVETVRMQYDRRWTLCISTQAGCAMGCVFCATGQMGFLRNLTIGEIVGQVIYFARDLARKNERVTNVVMMGMGEPFHNYENSLAAVDRIVNPTTLNLGARKITISTVGLIPAIRRFADELRQTKLAVSLHAATDEERDKLIRVNKKWPIDSLIDACRYYVKKTNRRITFEWALINGENDTLEQARRLGSLIQGIECYVNLIPLNPTNGFSGRPSSQLRTMEFQKELDRFGVTSTVRLRRGIDIYAGCGQLRERDLISRGIGSAGSSAST